MPLKSSDEDLRKLVASRLQSARKRAGLSQKAAAKAALCGFSTLQSWEAATASPNAVNLMRLCEVYGCSAAWLLAPDRSFAAIIDPAAERAAVTADDIQTWDECAQITAVVLSDRLEPITSRVAFNRRLEAVASAGDRLRGKKP